MNKESAKTKFVESNLEFLTSDQFTHKEFKRLQRQFFVDKHNKKFGLPGIKDVCEVTVKFFKKSGLEESKIKVYIETLPLFLRLDQKQRKQLHHVAQSEKVKSGLTKEDIALLRKGKAFEAVERHKGKEITEQQEAKLDELNKTIDEKQKEYDALPSVMDEKVFEEPVFNPEIEDLKPWWERFYLRSNPFPLKDGLSRIDQDLYESVVVKTEPFLRIQSKLQRDPDCLFNTAFMLVGGFGFGKTTFLDYLRYYVLNLDIVSFRITCGKTFSVANGFLDSFYTKLRTKLSQEARAIHSTVIGESELDVDDEIVFLSSLITDREKGKRGILILLDDYHKQISTTEAIFEFLGQLQILKDELTRNELKVGFIVSGLPEWEKHLPKHTQLSGFLDSPIVRMPAITPEQVVDVFDQRIRAYCVDSHARTLSKEFVKHIFEETGTDAGYREYLNRIIGELENNNFAIVDTPISIDDAELERIKSTVEKDPNIADAMNKLLKASSFKSFTKEQVGRCLELIVQIKLRNGVSEVDELFRQNTFYFQHLKSLQLIQKQKNSRFNSNFVWAIRKRLLDAFEEVQNKFGRGVSDYFLKIYAGKTAIDAVVMTQPQTPYLSKLNTLLGLDLAKPVLASFQMAKTNLDSLDFSRADKKKTQSRIKNGKRAIDSLLEAIFQLDGTQQLFAAAGIEDSILRYDKHWLDDETVSEALRRIEQTKPKSERLELEATLKQTKDACDALIETAEELANDLTDAKRPIGFRQNASRHTKGMLDILMEVQRDYYSGDPIKHFAYVERLTDHLEDVLRSYLYTTTVLAFGDNYFDKVPDDQKKYSIKNGKARTRYTSVGNQFEGFTRSQFRTVMNDKGDIKTMIVDAVGLDWQKEDAKLFYNLFAEESIATSHKNKTAYSAADRDRYITYCKLSEFLIAKLNAYVKKQVCELGVLLVDDVGSAKSNPNDCIFVFGTAKDRKTTIPDNRRIALGEKLPFVHAAKLSEHILSETELDKVKSNFQSNFASSDSLVIDLLDLEFLRNHYDVPFSSLVCSLSFMAHMENEIEILPWLGSSILVKQI